MSTKKCLYCEEFKSISEFYKNRFNKDGLQSYCKNCHKIKTKLFKRTKEGVINNIFSNQIKTSKRRNHKLPSYSIRLLKEWCLSQPKFHELYDNWVNSNFDKNLVPSIDRIDDSKGYSFDNIQLMTWKENKDKGHRDIRSGKLIHGVNPQKPVLQFDKTGNFINEFVSINEAARSINKGHSRISMNCNDKCTSAYGYKWKFK